MKEPYIKIELVDGTGTWVTVVPITSASPRHYGVILAAGEAAAMFIASLSRDAEVLDERLSRFDATREELEAAR